MYVCMYVCIYLYFFCLCVCVAQIGPKKIGPIKIPAVPIVFCQETSFFLQIFLSEALFCNGILVHIFKHKKNSILVGIFEQPITEMSLKTAQTLKNTIFLGISEKYNFKKRNP